MTLVPPSTTSTLEWNMEENVGVTITFTAEILLFQMVAPWRATVLPPSRRYKTNFEGDSTELCGGSWRLTMFTNSGYAPVTFTVSSITGWTYMGCYTDALNTRALSTNIYFDSAMTVEKCLAYCKTQGALTAGVEYGTQCYCGASLASWSVGSGLSADPVAYGCDMPCGGMTPVTERWLNFQAIVQSIVEDQCV